MVKITAKNQKAPKKGALKSLKCFFIEFIFI